MLGRGGCQEGERYLVRCLVLAEADVAIDAEDDVLDGELGDRVVDLDDLLGERLDVRVPVGQRAAVLLVVAWYGC